MQFLKVLFVTVVLAGCSTAAVPAARPPADSTQPATQRNPVETALIEAAGVQYGAYAELLGMLSNEGATPLLSLEVDLGADDPKKALAHYRRLIELTDRMAAAEAGFQEAIAATCEQTGLPNPGKAAPRNAVGWNLQLLSLLPVMQTGLLQSDLLHAGWKFWKWGENARRSARATVLGVAFADAEKHQLQKPEQEMMRRRVYEVARTRYKDQGEIGHSEREFFENLRDGKLDHIAQRLHADMSQDASDAGMAYMTITGVQGKRPIDIVYEEGCRGLAAGVDLYMAAGKRGVAGGLGPEAGKKFTEGYDKGVEIVEKIQEAETRVEQFREIVRDPIGYAQDKAPKVIQQRAVELLKDKTGLSDEVIEECTDQLGEAVQQVVQNVEVSRRIDEAYQRDRFLAELAKERGDQPAPGESLPEGPAAEGVRLRRITEQVHEEMAAEGWNLGTVKIDFSAAADAASDAARSSLDSVVAWWNDAQAGATRLTILPTPVASGTAVALPSGVQTELIELADSGTIHRLTNRPVVVSEEGVTQVAIEPPLVESPPEGLVMDDRETPVPQPDVPGRAAMPSSPLEEAGEQVLLSLPKSFDLVVPNVHYLIGGQRHEGSESTQISPKNSLKLAFRNGQTNGSHRASRTNEAKIRQVWENTFEGRLERGVLTGDFTAKYWLHDDSDDSLPDGFQCHRRIVRYRATGQADASGKMIVVLEPVDARCEGRQYAGHGILNADGSRSSRIKQLEDWRNDAEAAARMREYPMEFDLQLPVGQLQSSRKLMPE